IPIVAPPLRPLSPGLEVVVGLAIGGAVAVGVVIGDAGRPGDSGFDGPCASATAGERASATPTSPTAIRARPTIGAMRAASPSRVSQEPSDTGPRSPDAPRGRRSRR